MENEKNIPPLEESGSQAVKLLWQKSKDGTLKGVWNDWKWILSFTRKYWLSVVVYTLLGILSSGVALASGVVSKYLIDCIVTLNRQQLLPLTAAVVLTAVLAVSLRSISARFSARLNVNMLTTIRTHVFSRVIHADWMTLRAYPTGELISRFSGDIGTVSSCAVNWLPNVIIQAFTVIATLAVVLYYDPVMALLAFASTPVLFLASRRLLRRQRSFNQKLRQVGGDMTAFQAETFRNIDTLKSMGVEADICRRLDGWQQTYRKTTLEYSDFSVKTQIFLTILGSVVQYAAMGYCLWRLWRGEILFGTMVLFLQQRSQLSAAFSALVGQIPTALSGSVAAERVRELTQLPQESRSDDRQMHQGSCAVHMEKVRVSYSDDRKVVLEDVDLLAPAGTVVALVGPSGEGKSTIMRLLLGLVTPETGSLSAIEENGHTIPLGAGTRHLFAYVPQGNTVLAGTIAENLRLTNPEATEEEMIAALKDACVWEFVSGLPRGIHSSIGEGGKGLSEGQAQRIAIARALVRKAPVLLLDEVTSALDMETEQQVLENLTRRGLTCIAATHRPSVLSLCSRVYQVKDGKVTLMIHSKG